MQTCKEKALRVKTASRHFPQPTLPDRPAPPRLGHTSVADTAAPGRPVAGGGAGPLGRRAGGSQSEAPSTHPALRSVLRKPISSVGLYVNNELIASSNPNSQIDTETHYLLEKVVCEEVSAQEKYLKIDCAIELKEQWQDLHVEDEFVFVDDLENYHKKLPNLSTLLGRLKFFCVRDPLLDSEGENLTEENIFRECLTFQNEIQMQKSKNELQGIKEDFCKTTLEDKEYFMLPFELEFCKSSNSKSDSIKIPSYLELKELLNLASENMADGNMREELTKEDLKEKIVNKMEIAKYCPTSMVSSSSSISMLEISESESQCQSYCLLKGAAASALQDLTRLGVLASVSWSFDNIKFDHTRFFLKQQEKVISDHFKEGKVDEKEVMLFRHAALVHLLVTCRDLLLTCGLDTALGYLSKAKDICKNILESCLNTIWRQLKIVQYSSQKKHESSPKLTELQCRMLNWMQTNAEEHCIKILIIIRMDSEREKAALIHTVSRVEGLKAIDLNSEKKENILGYKDIISNRCACVIIQNQNIGADFPWQHFSLVIEYDYSENSCWKRQCENLNITYMAFKTILPETVQMGNHCGSSLLEVQIPYVFLTTEGLLNMPDFLQLLESHYSITFVERSCSYSLRLLGDTDRYVVLTVDECTAIFLQNMDELNHEKSCENVILKLTALSLQYTCCWVVFCSRERLSLEYSLRGDTLLSLALIYATLIEFTQKSEEFEVKVVLTPGIEEAALLIRQIADNILMTSSFSPHEWLDKSWLSVLPSEMEKHLLTFPCINPLVAQLMLKKETSLNRLFLASFDQLQKFLPEVPKKVLKHFSDITSSYSINAAPPLKTTVKRPSPPENWNTFERLYPDYKQNSQSLVLPPQAQTSTGPSHVNSEATFLPLKYNQGFINSSLSSCMHERPCFSEVAPERKENFFVVPRSCEDFAHLNATNSFHVKGQAFRTHYVSDRCSKTSEKDFFTTFSDCIPPDSSTAFLEEFRDTAFKSPEILIDETPWNDFPSTSTYNSFATNLIHSDSLVDPDEIQTPCSQNQGREPSGKRKRSAPFLWAKGKKLTDLGFEQVPRTKKRRLMYERVPGRADGQTRLKFF
eukprot:XP_025000888.1 uncharacterized protein C9orf84 homolog [Gallus gallus]